LTWKKSSDNIQINPARFINVKNMKNLAANISDYLSQTLRIPTLVMTDYSGSSHSRLNTSINAGNEASYQFKKIKKFIKNSKVLPFIVVGVIVLLVVVLIVHTIAKHQAMAGQTPAVAAANTPVSVAKPLQTESLNKSYMFPLNDSTGKQVSQIQYVIQSAELDNEIVVQGQVATAVQGRVFLVLNLAITNNYDKSVQLNTRDYIRLVVDNSSSKLAADIHNDPVDVEAISTKYTRLGFPIDSNFKTLTLQVGQISGTKQTIQLNFK
jgi:hypothetical protein